MKAFNIYNKIIIAMAILFIIVLFLTILPCLPGPSLDSFGHILVVARSLIQLLFVLIGLVSILFLIFTSLVWLIIVLVGKVFVNKYFKWNLYILLFVLVTLFVSSFLQSLSESFSRKYAVKNARELIKALEDYKINKSEYPQKIENLVSSYIKILPKPGIISIPRYSYEVLNRNEYLLSFVQNSNGFNFYVVMYNPKKIYKAKGELEELYDVGIDGWTYYCFD